MSWLRTRKCSQEQCVENRKICIKAVTEKIFKKLGSMTCCFCGTLTFSYNANNFRSNTTVPAMHFQSAPLTFHSCTTFFTVTTTPSITPTIFNLFYRTATVLRIMMAKCFFGTKNFT